MEKVDNLVELKPQKRDDRPAEFFDRYHRRTRRMRRLIFVYNLCRLFLTPFMKIVYRLEISGKENISREGAVILVANHASFLDHFCMGLCTRRKVRFMGKSNMFIFPMKLFFSFGGVFPVRRGHQDEEAIITARTILEYGQIVGKYPHGGRFRPGEPVRVKSGVGRLALETGAPVVPIAIHGTLRVRNWWRGEFPKIRVRIGEPIHFTQDLSHSPWTAKEVAEEVMAEVDVLYEEIEASLSRDR